MIDFKKLKHAYKKISVYDIQNYSCISSGNINSLDSKIINEMKNTSFCPHSITEYYLKCNKFLKIAVEGVSLQFFYANEFPQTMYKVFKTIKQCIIIKEYFDIKKSFNIFVVCAPNKRFIPQSGHITCEHINGGWTSTSHDDIFIIRSEEFAKVIIHEMLHHCIKIQNNNWTREDIMILKKQFNISDKTVLVPNESIIELWATILYTLFLSFEYGIKYDVLIKKEIEHSIKQYNKILKKQNNTLWYEETNSYCYIVFKTIILCNLEDFLHDCKWPYNPKYVTKFLIKHASSIKKMIISKDTSLRMMKLSDY